MPDSRALSSSHFNSRTAHLSSGSCSAEVSIRLRVPHSSKDDTDTLYCQISSVCHSSLPKIKMNMLIYFLLQAAAQMREGERACSALSFLLRATRRPTDRVLPSCTRLADQSLAFMVNP